MAAPPLKTFVELRRLIRVQIAAAAEEGGGAREILAAFLRNHFEFLSDHPEAAALLYDEAAAPSGERAGQELARALRVLLSECRKIIKRGKAEKAIRGDVDPAMAAVHFLGVIQMAWTLGEIGGRRGRPSEGAASDLFEQFWEGLRV
jgi:AcrR family transcriptional regulator